MKSTLLCVVVLLVAGCALQPVMVLPNVSTRDRAATLKDSRPAITAKTRSSEPIEPGSMIGVWPGGLPVVLPPERSALQLVAGVIGMHVDAESVELTRFELSFSHGIWANRAFLDIAANVKTRDGRSLTLTGRGENLMVSISAANFAVAVERALKSLSENAKASG